MPTYDRGALSPGIVHFGVGGFHRAHQGVYLDDLAQCGVSREWGVVGVGLRRRDMRHALTPQDCLYTVVERDAGGDRARVIGAMRHCMFGPDDPRAVLGALTAETTRAVTLTITGEGYVAPEQHGGPAPPTAFGYIVEALRWRRRAGIRPFTVISCDNVPRNGQAAREGVVSCARSRDEVLARWIERHVAFPSGVVDRITPETTSETRAFVQQSFGIRDRSPVATEAFTQWILEDEFCNERPPLEEVGVQFVADARPYELMKKRLLNGGHSALGYLGWLAGHRRTDEVLRDGAFRRFVRTLLEDEIAPLVPPVPGVDLHAYTDSLIERFGNPQIADPLARLCRRGSTKMAAYLLPSLDEALTQGRPHGLLALSVAGWFRYLAGRDDGGAWIPIEDPRLETLVRAAARGGSDPRPLLAELGPFAPLRHNGELVRVLSEAMASLERDGARATVAASLAPAVAEAV